MVFSVRHLQPVKTIWRTPRYTVAALFGSHLVVTLSYPVVQLFKVTEERLSVAVQWQVAIKWLGLPSPNLETHARSHKTGWCLVPSSEWMFWAPLTSMDCTPSNVTAGGDSNAVGLRSFT